MAAGHSESIFAALGNALPSIWIFGDHGDGISVGLYARPPKSTVPVHRDRLRNRKRALDLVVGILDRSDRRVLGVPGHQFPDQVAFVLLLVRHVLPRLPQGS